MHLSVLSYSTLSSSFTHPGRVPKYVSGPAQGLFLLKGRFSFLPLLPCLVGVSLWMLTDANKRHLSLKPQNWVVPGDKFGIFSQYLVMVTVNR